jgi:vacuolar protein-sorting-associated protein 4
MASEEIACAKQCEARGQRQKAVRHYKRALQHYLQQLSDSTTDQYTGYVIVKQSKLVMEHVAKVRADIEQRPRNDDVDDDTDDLMREPAPNTTAASSTTTSDANLRQKRHAPTAVIAHFPAIPQALPPQAEQTDEANLKDRILALCLRPDEIQDVRWEDVIGLENVKRVIRLAVEVPHQLAHIYGGNRVAATALLMYGPPGVGKTYIVKALARQCQHTFLPVSCASIISKYVGDSPKYVKAMLEVAKANKPCILFIDEIDALCPDRGGGGGGGGASSSDARTIAEFLQQLDGITKDDMKGVVVIGATNQPWVIDDAMRRRFARMIYIPLPDAEDRYRLVAHRLNQNSDDAGHSISEQEMWQLAHDTENYSSADLVKLIVTAYEATIEQVTLATHFRATRERSTGQKVLVPCSAGDEGAYALSYQAIGQEDRALLRPNAVTYRLMRATMERIKPSVDLKKLASYAEFTAMYGEAS